MIFKEVSLKNFYRFPSTEQTFRLDRGGMWCIYGHNGYGKSTIIEAIVWCLFGKTRQDVVDDVVNRKTKKDCKVSVTFTDGKNEYKVIRYRQHTLQKNNILIFVNDEDKTPHTAAETNQMIEDILGFNYITFENSTIFSSTLYNKFLDADNKDRLVVMENLLDLKQITAFYAKTKDLIKETKKSLTEAQSKCIAKSSEISSLESSIAEYKKSAKEKLLELKEKKKQIEEKKKELIEKKKELSVIDVEKEKELLLNKKALDELKKSYEERKKDLKDSKVASNEAIEFVEKYTGIDFDAEIEKEERNKALSEEKEKLTSELKEKVNKAETLKKEDDDRDEKKKNIQKEIEELEGKISKIETGICPTCHQPIGVEESERQRKEYEKRKEELSTEMVNLNNSDNSKEIQNIKTECLELKKKIEGIVLETCVNNSAVLKEKFIKYSAEIKSVEESNEIIKTGNEIVEADLARMKESIDKYSGSDNSKWTIDALNNISNTLAEIEKSITNCDVDITAILGSVSTVYDKSFVEKNEKVIESKAEELEEFTKEKNSFEEDEKYYSYLADCFSNKSGGFKKYFIGEMIGTFNENISKFVPFFFNEKISISFDKDLNDIIEMDDEKISYKSLSRGQKTRAELAIAFALFELSRYYYSNCNNILMVDEMLDEGLDQYGMRAAISVLQGFTDTTVYVISHNDELKNLIENKIEITRDENEFSVIKE